MVTCHYFVYYYHINRIPVNKVQGYVLVRPLLVSGVAWIGEHLNVVARLHHVMPHKCVDDRSLYHVWKREKNRDRVRISLQRACYIFVYQLMVTVWVIKDVVSQTDLQINHFKKN